ncbi:hypothetical protein RDABS01_001753 [Bienertia sinuspersici]
MHLLRNSERVPHESPIIWRLVWSLPVQQRIRVFLWLTTHNKILCNANRLKRHLTDDPRCPRCPDTEETLLHTLWGCPAAREVWRGMGGAARLGSFYQGDLQAWLTQNLEANGVIYTANWPIFFAITLWWNWRWRNCVVFGKSHEIPNKTTHFLQALFDESKLRKGHLSPGLAGGGGIIRNSMGGYIVAFAANYGVCSAYKAELKAAYQGLQLAKELGLCKIMLQMDNQACIQAMRGDDISGGEIYHLVLNCRKLIRQDLDVGNDGNAAS